MSLQRNSLKEIITNKNSDEKIRKCNLDAAAVLKQSLLHFIHEFHISIKWKIGPFLRRSCTTKVKYL